LCPYVLDAQLGLWVSLEHAYTCACTTNQIQQRSGAANFHEHMEILTCGKCLRCIAVRCVVEFFYVVFNKLRKSLHYIMLCCLLLEIALKSDSLVNGCIAVRLRC